MKRSWHVLAGLLIAVLALCWFVYQRPAPETPGKPLSTVAPADIQQIRIERAGRAPMVLQRRDGIWRITAPLAAPAEPFHVQRLLAVSEARSTLHVPATDLERFDLAQPVLKLTLDQQTFDFGAINAVTGEQYVLTNGAVQAVPPRYTAAVPTDPAMLVRRQLLDPGIKPVKFQLREFSVTQRNGKWALTPEPAELSQDDVLQWIEQWQLASALRIEPWDGRPAIDAVTLDFPGGKRLVLNIIQRDPQLIIRPGEEQLAYYFAGDAARRLLAPPASAKNVARH